MGNHVGDGCGNAHDADFTQALNATAIDQRVRLFHEDDIMSYTSDASISEFADTPAHHAIRTENTLTNFINKLHRTSYRPAGSRRRLADLPDAGTCCS